MKCFVWSTRGFYLVLAIVSFVSVLKATVPAVQIIFLEQFHLRSASFIRWMCLQPVPSMYNFANEICWTDNPDPGTCWNSTREAFPQYHAWLNHNPLRFLSFSLDRQKFWRTEQPQYVHLRSRFQGRERVTRYQIVRHVARRHLEARRIHD